MFNSKILLFTLISSLLLAGCGGSKSTKSTASKAKKPSVTPKEVHHIAPKDVMSKVEEFQAQNEKVKLVLDGQEIAFNFADFAEDNKSIVATLPAVTFDGADYKSGVLEIGFDKVANEPLNTLVMSLTSKNGKSARVFTAVDFKVKGQGDDLIYVTQMRDIATFGTYDLNLTINESFFESGSSTLKISGTSAKLNGTLGTQTFVQIRDLTINHPEVTTLVLDQISGSVNDAINMHTGYLIRYKQLTTSVTATSDINSGGVDLFAAGYVREYTKGAKVGVHAWCCGEKGESAHLLSKTDPAHGAQLTYFRKMLGADLGPKFYFFTLNAAPAADIHVMTKVELDKYLLVK